MSHLIAGKLELNDNATDLAALAEAAKALGGHLIRGQTKHKWFEVSVGDAALPDGLTVAQIGHCAHAIKLPGANYEVGVYRKPDGKLTCFYDSWSGYDGKSTTHDGYKLEAAFGKGCAKLSQQFAYQRIKAAAKAKGYMQSMQTLGGGEIKMTINMP